MPLPRQSRLATSAQQTLCIERPPLLHPGESTTTVIPDEILVEVFSYLGLKGSCFAGSEHQECLPLTLVCKRWRRVYEPFLYRRIDLGYFGWKKSRRVRQLLQNLQDRPDLGRQVKSIHIQAYNPNPSTSMNIAKIVTNCKAARHISLHMSLTDPTVPLLDAVARLPSLETLSVSGHSGGPSVYTILQYFNLPSLSNLRLCRYGIGKGTSPGAPWPWDVPASAHDLDELLPSNRYHTSRVTSLELSDPSTPPRVTELILRWPQHLETLSIHSLLHSSYAREYTLTCVERLLAIHRQSLKSITIGIIPGRRTGMPDFSSFECLEELHMSAYQLVSETPSNAQIKLAAPCLCQLSMSFSIEDQHSESHNAFAADQVRWMADFAELKTRYHPESKLNRMYISFRPDDSPLWWDDFEQDVTWPWEYLDKAVQILAQHGVALTYSEPSWSKQEWGEALQQGKALKAQRDAGVTSDAEDA